MIVIDFFTRFFVCLVFEEIRENCYSNDRSSDIFALEYNTNTFPTYFKSKIKATQHKSLTQLRLSFLVLIWLQDIDLFFFLKSSKIKLFIDIFRKIQDISKDKKCSNVKSAYYLN